MALNSKVVRLVGCSIVTLFGNPNRLSAIAIAIAIWDLGNLGSWDLGPWQLGTLAIWDHGKLVSW